MALYRGLPVKASVPCVLTIGNFDGVHRGHQALFHKVVHVASVLGLPAVALTFEPHPRTLFSSATPLHRISSFREKTLRLLQAGLDRIHVCRFDRAFASLEPDAFIEQVLMQALGVRHLFVGDDFRFGQGRQGDFAMLQSAGETLGFHVESMPTLSVAGERVSSSAIRQALLAGEMGHAQRLLGRPYALSGRVVHGQKLGRTLGFPTANLALKGLFPPLSGVFAVWVEGLSDHPVPGAASVGVRPTVADAGARPRLEVHLLDWQRDCYGAHVRVHFMGRLRDEQRYPDLDALKAQIERDVFLCRRFLATHPPASGLMA